MAANSFDKVISFMTLKRWKWLHRLVYGAVILVILHVWMIGTHVAYQSVQIVIFILLAVFFGLESYRFVHGLAKTHRSLAEKKLFFALTTGLSLLWIILLLLLPSIVKNYHSERHADHSIHGGHHE
jgi:DMSO/TMAO reductase YedYZ heme-binding membrane subunit